MIGVWVLTLTWPLPDHSNVGSQYPWRWSDSRLPQRSCSSIHSSNIKLFYSNARIRSCLGQDCLRWLQWSMGNRQAESKQGLVIVISYCHQILTNLLSSRTALVYHPATARTGGLPDKTRNCRPPRRKQTRRHTVLHGLCTVQNSREWFESRSSYTKLTDSVPTLCVPLLIICSETTRRNFIPWNLLSDRSRDFVQLVW